MTNQKVFDQFWFKKHQKILVWLVNNWLGRLIFRYRKMGHYPTNKIVKITPNSLVEFLGVKKGKIELKQHFFTRNEYARKLYFVLLPVWWAMHAWDILFANNFAPELNFGFDTLPVYPVAGANSPVDGFVRRNYVDETWATIIGGAGTDVDVTVKFSYLFNFIPSATSGQWQDVTRSIFLFDTSALTAGATISAAVLSFYGTSQYDSHSLNPDADVYAATPANTNNLVSADYSQIGTVSQTGSPITYANWDVAGYNNFTFLANKLGNISKTGISKFGARNANYDVAGSIPDWYQWYETRFSCYFADNGSNKPKLVVTYTIAVAATGNFFRMF